MNADQRSAALARCEAGDVGPNGLLPLAVRELLDDGDALESLLVAADREVADLRATIEAVTRVAADDPDKTLAHEDYDLGWDDAMTAVRAVLAAVVSVETPTGEETS